jgi:hypothetical protein
MTMISVLAYRPPVIIYTIAKLRAVLISLSMASKCGLEVAGIVKKES